MIALSFCAERSVRVVNGSPDPSPARFEYDWATWPGPASVLQFLVTQFSGGEVSPDAVKSRRL